jgi:structural maintenance of chromosome 2
MYEMKKVGAQKTIEKKQSKVDEINKILTDEITPTLEKLRKERANYQQWVHNNTEIERLSRFCIAHEFFQLEEAIKSTAESSVAMQQQIVELKERSEELKVASQTREEEMQELLVQVCVCMCVCVCLFG